MASLVLRADAFRKMEAVLAGSWLYVILDLVPTCDEERGYQRQERMENMKEVCLLAADRASDPEQSRRLHCMAALLASLKDHGWNHLPHMTHYETLVCLKYDTPPNNKIWEVNMDGLPASLHEAGARKSEFHDAGRHLRAFGTCLSLSPRAAAGTEIDIRDVVGMIRQRASEIEIQTNTLACLLWQMHNLQQRSSGLGSRGGDSSDS